MTVKEVIAELQKLPENMDVFVPSRACEEPYATVWSVKQREVTYMEETEDGEEYRRMEAVVIDEQ